jgi:hypothetical protein
MEEESMTSKRKAAANRINGQKSHGPTDTTTTRFNAAKHGLLAAGLTELDDAEGYRALLNTLREEKAPVGIVETSFVESIALEMIRMRRARRLEAEYITSALHPPTLQAGAFELPDLCEPTIIDPGLPPSINFETGQRLVSIFQRYESNFINRIIRYLHELERLQRMRRGEKLPAPTAVDVSVHVSDSNLPEALEKPADTKIVDSARNVVDVSGQASESSMVEPLAESADVAMVDSASAAMGRPSPSSGDEELKPDYETNPTVS